MYEVIALPNGENEIITDIKDIVDIGHKYLGCEYGYLLEGNLQDNVKEKEYARIKAESDLECYELSLESNSTAFMDILDEIEALNYHLDNDKRMNRDKIRNIIEHITTIINNQI